MALPSIVTKDDLSKLDEAARGHYIQIPAEQAKASKLADGEWYRIDATPVHGWGIEPVASLKAALGAERSNVDSLTSKLKDYEPLGPASDAAKLIAKAKNMDDYTPTEQAKAARQAAIDELSAKHEAEMKSLREQVASLDAESDTYVRDGRLISLLSPHAVDPQAVAKLLRDQVKKVRKDGKPALVVVDANGNPRISMKPGHSGDMTEEELIDEWKANPANAWMMKPNGVSGAGTHGSAGPSGARSGSIPRSVMKNPREYQRMKAELSAQGVDISTVPINEGA
jgi:hypothetical protein